MAQTGVVLFTIIINGDELPVSLMVRRFRNAPGRPYVLGRRRKKRDMQIKQASISGSPDVYVEIRRTIITKLKKKDLTTS